MKTYSLPIISIACMPAILLAQNSKASQRPNIIVFIADDAGMDFGCYGNKAIKTPNIDKLAQQGIRFENAFHTSPQSSPSRTSMMTGCFAHSIGTEDLHDPLNTKTKMLPAYFNKAGYATGSMLKRHWGENGDKQFSVLIKGGYLPQDGGLEDETYQNYTQFLDQNLSKPFFLWVGFIDPHRPYTKASTPQINNPKDVIVPPYLVDDAETRNDLANYYNEISRMDGDIGIMISELEKRKLLDNTIIVFLSDNGMPFPRAKASLYDSGIKTPLIFAWKNKIKPGSVHKNGLASTVDLAPTLLNLANITTPAQMYGKSMSKILFNDTIRGRSYIFSERNWHDTDDYIRCVRTEKYKYIYNAYYSLPFASSMDITESDSWYALKKAQRNATITKAQSQIFTCPRPMIEIYDIENDPYELNNIADTKEGIQATKECPLLIKEWQKQTIDHPYWMRKKADNTDRITGAPYYMISDSFYND